MLQRVLTIARWTVTELLRERILYVALLFVVVLVAGSCVLTPLAPGAQRKVVADFGLASIDVLGVLVILLSGCGLVRREIERRSLEVLLCKPLSRLEYLLGKCLGLFTTLCALVLVMTVLFGVMALVSGVGWRMQFLWAIGATLFELLIVASLAVLFSVVTSPTLAALFTLSLFAAGHLQDTIVRLAHNDSVDRISNAVRWLVPALEVFDVRAEVVYGVAIPRGQVLGGAAYAALYAVTAVFLASVVFRRKELK